MSLTSFTQGSNDPNQIWLPVEDGQQWKYVNTFFNVKQIVNLAKVSTLAFNTFDILSCSQFVPNLNSLWPVRLSDLSHLSVSPACLQIIVWGDYGRMDHKSFMGAAQILLDDLDLSNMVIGWFKLFPATSLVDPALAPLTNKETEGSKS